MCSLALATSVLGQLPLHERELISRLEPSPLLPKDLLMARTAVFHSYLVGEEDLGILQSYFRRSGIDAVVYFELDLLTAGRDVSQAMAQYLLSREISNIVLVQKDGSIFTLWVTPFNQQADFVDKGQQAWMASNRLLLEILKPLYRTAAGELERTNLLINDYPETGLSINPIQGRRSEFFAIDLKVDPLAVPKFNDENMDKELEEIMKMYPYEYTLTDPTLSEAELRKQGLYYVLRFVNARAHVAKRLMGYPVSQSSSAIVSITYPGSEPQVKNIPINRQVYKFYFKHIDSGNTFLGTKWDADETWQQALLNQLKAYRIEFKIN